MRQLFLTTKRLELLIPEAQDLPAVIRMYSDPRLMAHLGGPLSAEMIQHRFLLWQDLWKKQGFGPSLLRWRDGGEWVGSVAIFETKFDGEPVLEIGWMIMSEFQGRGFATEATRALISYARKEFPKKAIIALPGLTNRASNHVCEKLEMTKRGELVHRWLDRALHSAHWRIDPLPASFGPRPL